MSHAPLAPIDPVELMLVAIGLKPIISREVETIGRSKLKEMARIPKEIVSLARQLVNNELTPSFYSDFNYRKAIKELAAGWDMQQVADMIAKFPPEYQVTGSALILKAQQTIQQLLEGYPVSQYQTVTGSIDLLPSDAKLFKFVSILEIVDQPLMVFSFMSAGSLLRSQAHAIRTVYPSLSAAIDAAIMQATISAKANKASFELPPRAEVGVKAWMGQGPTTVAQLVAAQTAATKSKADQAKPKPKAAPAKASNIGLQTNVQRSETP
jgi:hypothetical protein